MLPARVERLLAPLICTIAWLTCAPATAQGDGKFADTNSRAALDSRIAREGSAKVIVTLQLPAPFRAPGYLSAEAGQAQRATIADVQQRVLAELASAQVAHAERFREVPQIAMTVGASALARLAVSPLVATVVEDSLSRPLLDQSVPRVGAPAMWSNGLTGTGQVVAVLDTGVQGAHPFLTGSVVSGACYSNANQSGISSTPDYRAQSACPGGAPAIIGPFAAEPYPGACQPPHCNHGTQVAGVIAGRNNGSFSGVAPGAQLIAVQVFTWFDNAAFGPVCGGGFSCVAAYASDVIRGLQRVSELRTTYNIAAVNLSLGGGFFDNTSQCDALDPRKPMIDTLRSQGIATIAPSGNGGAVNGLQAPGCISSLASVGATNDADAVEPYSNSASFLTLLAPGTMINTSVPFGPYGNATGTSLAAAHVAGGVALVKQARPDATVGNVFVAMTSTGLPRTDPKNGLTKPRLRIDQAAQSLPRHTGFSAIGTFVNGLWSLDNNGNRTWEGTAGGDLQISFGVAGDIPVVGDWNGSGFSKIGVFRAGKWYLDYNGNGVWDGPSVDRVYAFGLSDDKPVVGVWTAGGPARIGVFRNGTWYLDINGNGQWDAGDALHAFGTGGDEPVAGDWNGDGVSKIGVFRSGTWYLDYNGNRAWDGPATDLFYTFGTAGDIPVVGDWNGKGPDKIGVFRSGGWYIDYAGGGAWAGAIADLFFTFGGSGHRPAVGKLWQLIIG